MHSTSEIRYCIVCGRQLDPGQGDEMLCPDHAHAAPSAGPVSASGPEPINDLGVVLGRCPPPMVDFALGLQGEFYVLDSGMGGEACSVACWNDGELQGSVMLKVPDALAVVVLPGGGVTVVGRRGTVVTVTGLMSAAEGELPHVGGHETHWGVSCAAEMPRAQAVALGVPADECVYLLRVPDYESEQVVRELAARPVALAFSFDGSRLAVGSNDGSLRVVDVTSRRTVWERTPRRFDGEGVLAVAARAGGGWAVAYESQDAAVWSADGDEVGCCRRDHQLAALHVDFDTDRVALGDRYGDVEIWSPSLDRVLARGHLRDSRLVRVILMPEAQVLIGGVEGGEVVAGVLGKTVPASPGAGDQSVPRASRARDELPGASSPPQARGREKVSHMRERFTPDEWQQLVHIPVDAFLMVAMADKKVDKAELETFVETLVRASDLRNPLHRELALDVASKGAPGLLEEIAFEAQERTEEMLSRIERSKATLQAKLAPQEYQDFLGSVLTSAVAVAGATGKHRFSKKGKISQEENNALQLFCMLWEIDLTRALQAYA